MDPRIELINKCEAVLLMLPAKHPTRMENDFDRSGPHYSLRITKVTARDLINEDADRKLLQVKANKFRTGYGYAYISRRPKGNFLTHVKEPQPQG